jgi:hypothetical protein
LHAIDSRHIGTGDRTRLLNSPWMRDYRREGRGAIRQVHDGAVQRNNEYLKALPSETRNGEPEKSPEVIFPLIVVAVAYQNVPILQGIRDTHLSITILPSPERIE